MLAFQSVWFIMKTLAEESGISQPVNKLEKSLDAIAALRREMEQRMAEAKAAQAKADEIKAKLQEAPKPEPKVAQEQPQAPASAGTVEDTAQETPIHFDPVQWSQIMTRVMRESQSLFRDYLVRTQDKKIATPAFTPLPIADTASQMAARVLKDPEAYADAQLASWQNYLDLTRATLLRMQGHQTTPIAEAEAKDKRFKAEDWQTNWMFDFLKQSYLKNVDETRRLIRQEKTHIRDKMAEKLDFYARLFLDATAPNNFFLTNPEVLRKTLETKGDNLIKGVENYLRDLESGNGLLNIRMSDYSAFELGKNIATTPGKVVYQNDLMQLIQYAPSTETAKRVPLLLIPPWINKYYILDLRENNSFIRYLVAQGHTVFCISWVNPTKKHALTQLEDYMEKGALDALRQIKRLTGENEANVMGYCIGGTMLACAQAYLAALKEKPADLPKIASSTYLVTMIDFSQPGDLGVFIDEDQIKLLEERMARQGFMDANSMVLTFSLLRANDLIWPYVINNYLMGREPFPFDILYWNTDSTNLPAAMHSYYLRMMYKENKLIEPYALKMKGVPIDVAEIETPTFLLSTREDHISPWRSTYAAAHLYKGPVTFCLSGSGHIAGVVNPPDANKYGYWTNSDLPQEAEDWFKNATPHKGSWWPEWLKWLDQYAGENVPARQVLDGIEDAPGGYVKVRAV